MPSRPVTAAIILFWLATTGVLVYRELASRIGAGAAPPFTIPLMAEVSETTVEWQVMQKGQPIGTGKTKIKPGADRIFELSAKFVLKQLDLLIELQDVKIDATYRVTEEGHLVSSAAKLSTRIEFLGIKKAVLDFNGIVKEGLFHPQLTLAADGNSMELDVLEPFPIAENSSVLNPMHLVHKISGLRDGQRWPIPLMDPLRAVPKLKDLASGKVTVVDHLIATVTTDNLPWPNDDAVVPCFKIEYAKPDDRPIAATWVRRADDAVLQQWASYEGMEFTVRRVPER
jgi:hypothetical protein